ncbi:MAG: glutamate 5-kinase [Cyclobacteriaceae bacterium]|nr:glutamate 5-kinase [Cyclobacteriaceae bacterium]
MSDSYLFRRIAIKVGSNVLTKNDGLPNLDIMLSLVKQMANLNQEGVEVILISSGAVAAGRGLLSLPAKTDPVAGRQVLSSIGQVQLMQHYTELFKSFNLLCAQVLVTRQDFKDRQHYLNMRSCINTLLQYGIIPVVNENDVVSVTELMFTDNDELAGLVAAMVNADALIILSNIDGVYDGDPAMPGSKIISVYDPEAIDLDHIASTKKSGFGRGGIITKCRNAIKSAGLGTEVFIANGYTESVISRIAAGENLGTRFKAKKSANNIKKWIGHSAGFATGKVYINQGAAQILKSQKAASLLPVGITHIEGFFQKNDIIRIFDHQNKEIGLGRAQYGDKKAQEVVGLKNEKPLVHYDHLYLY